MEPITPELAERIRALPARMSHVVRPWAERTPDAVALLEGDRMLSYRQLADAIGSVGGWLKARGLRPGDRAMIVGENSIALAVLVLAIGEVDAWPIVANARISAREVDAIRDHSGARVVLYTTANSVDAVRHAERHGAVVEDVPGIGPLAAGSVNGDAVPEPVHADGARQVGGLLYTSGTTGAPKGVMLSHRNVLFTAAVSGVLRDIGPADRIYGVLPMSHIVGFAAVLVGMLMFGASVDLVPRSDPAATLAALEHRGITYLLGVPTTYQRLLEQAGGAPIRCPALRNLGVVGAPLDLSLKSSVERELGLVLNNGYGITECSPTIAITRLDDPCADEAVGPPIPGIETRLIGPDGGAVAADGVGELHVRGPNVMLGYYRAPELTRAVVDADGWFNTGDLARFSGRNLYIVGRTKELIIRSGFNVYPPEVEAVLAAHPAVASVAVVGRKVPGNEEVVAFVQLRPDVAASPGDIAAFAAERLAPYKRPAEIVVKAALPVTSAGKILKHQLAQEASGHVG